MKHILYSLFFLSSLWASDEGPLVNDVAIQRIGTGADITDSVIYSHIKVHKGGHFQQHWLDQSIQALYGTGYFDFIEAKVTNEADAVKVVFIVETKSRIQDITFVGNKKMTTRTLLSKMKEKTGDLADEAKLRNDVNTLLEYYQKKGYPDVKITAEFQAVRPGHKKAVFTVNEGTFLKVKGIVFTGNKSIPTDELRDQMKTRPWGIFSFLSGSGRFTEDVFKEDLNALRAYYRNHGFLDVEISREKVILERVAKERLQIVIPVDEGKRYSFGKITFSENKLFDNAKLADAITIKEGTTYSPAEVEKATEAIRNFYGEKGYLESYATPERSPNITTDAIDLNFKVKESDKFYVENIDIQGNTATKSNVILREINLAPGDEFDLVSMRNSEAKLQTTRYFKSVMLTPEATDIPNRKNLRITLEEGNTGSIMFGVATSTEEPIAGFIELSQSNFDIKNFKNFFRGGGQKFRIRTQLGTKSNQVIITFEEPWVFDRELTFGTEIYRTQSNYYSKSYKEGRLGANFYLRKRLFGLWTGQLTYGVEEVRIWNVKDDAPTTIKGEDGSRSVSKLMFSIERDTRDNLVMPKTGSRIEAHTGFAGGPLFGQTRYITAGAGASRWWTVFKTMEQVFGMSARTATIGGYGGKNVPFFDRFFLGGSEDMRGFEFRDVGPKEGTNHDPIGGKTYAFGTAEYSFRLIDSIRFAVFTDWGFVNSRTNDWSTTNYNADWGFGLRIIVMGAPLRLDLGFPFKHDPYNKHTAQFQFSFGTVF
ncbi:MAG: outer membrane protein assembly factor BamA [Verrucomicrobia bacterium GWF2_51_19]|nr:MAG: outer membrane protein assembly factor BamA [Verrucomicrobia bacterium GWF2_51_19]HCJ12246.1 outer membrane protein assembly factor BamA [Opitutae bacterium]